MAVSATTTGMPATGLITRAQQNTVDSTLTGGTALAALVVRYFADFQRYLDPTETPFTSSLKTGAAVPQKKVEWGNSFLAPHQSATGASIADGSTTSVTVATGDGSKFMVNDVLQVESERLWVTAISSDTLTVKRAFQGTTGAAHTVVGTLIDILGPATIENQDTPITPVARGSLEYNLPQLFDYGLHLSDRENNTMDYEITKGTKYEAYLAKLMKEAAIDFEKTAILGKRGTEVAATGATATPTTMGGLDYFTNREYIMAGAPFSEDQLMQVAQDLWTAVGEEKMATNILVGGFGKRAISSLFNSNRIATVKDKTTTLVWTEIETDFGKLRFTLSRYIPAGSAYFVNLNDITIHPYKGGAWKEVRLPSSGPYVKGRFTGDYTMVFRGNAARAKITGASTTVADYPNM
jgi:hypothetical protein